MSGAEIVKMPPKSGKPEIIELTPELAMKLLEHNNENRPLSQAHVQRIAKAILAGQWRFNGDTLKIATDGDVLDGQHRCWAVIEAKRSVKTAIVYGIERDAFATIDTGRRLRSGGDVLALNGVSRYRTVVSSALMWLLRWQRGVIESWRAPQNKIENFDIEAAFSAHLNITQAVERAMRLRRLTNPSVIAFLYYVMSNRNADLAERMMDTLEDPSRVPLNDPFYRLRLHFQADHYKRRDPLMTIALAIKAANAAAAAREVEVLSWKTQGDHPEKFPVLEI